MENERLKQLHSQKELILQHLDWINQEIDRENLAHAPTFSPAANRLAKAIASDEPVAQGLRSTTDVETMTSDQVASDLYSELGPDTRNAAASAQRGCLAISITAFAALAALVLYVAFWY